jgi:hypothetical protein
VENAMRVSAGIAVFALKMLSDVSDVQTYDIEL